MTVPETRCSIFTTVEQMRAGLARCLVDLNVAADVVYAIARAQHNQMLEDVAATPEGNHCLQWNDPDGGFFDCLVPFEECPEGFRIAMQGTVVAMIKSMRRSGFTIVPLQ